MILCRTFKKQINKTTLKNIISYIKREWSIILNEKQIKDLLENTPADNDVLAEILSEFWSNEFSWTYDEISDVLMDCMARKIGYKYWPKSCADIPYKQRSSKKKILAYWRRFQKKLIENGFVITDYTWCEERANWL